MEEKENEEVKEGYKIFTKTRNNYYSYGLGLAIHRIKKEHPIKNSETRRLKRFFIKYSKEEFIEGAPWIALFPSKKIAKEAEDLCYTSSMVILKVLYIPYEKHVNMVSFGRLQDVILDNKYWKVVLKTISTLLCYVFARQSIPDGTIFASKIKIVEEA